MGLFDGMFGAKYSQLADDTEEARLIAGSSAFERFVRAANDRIEVLAGEAALYAFIGKPPKAFGVVWFEGEERFDVRSLMERGAMTRDAAAGLVAELTRVYEANSDATRSECKVGGHRVIVAQSDQMYEQTRQAVQRAMS
jgi:hypothetical protein